jgi:hypothetical protein
MVANLSQSQDELKAVHGRLAMGHGRREALLHQVVEGLFITVKNDWLDVFFAGWKVQFFSDGCFGSPKRNSFYQHPQSLPFMSLSCRITLHENGPKGIGFVERGYAEE